MFAVLKTERYSSWFAGLRDRAGQLRITARLKRIEQGNMGDAQSVGGGVSEIRLNFGPGYRVYFTRHGRDVIVLLGGGDKSSQARDIKAAQAIATQLIKD